MKRLLLVLFLLPILLFGAAGTETTMIPDYSNIESYCWIKGDTSAAGITIVEAAAVDDFYIVHMNIGKYNTGSLFLFGDVDSIAIYKRTAPTPALLTSFEWDSLTETAATDTVFAYNFTGLNSSDFMDLMIKSVKTKAGTFNWFSTLLK